MPVDSMHQADRDNSRVSLPSNPADVVIQHQLGWRAELYAPSYLPSRKIVLSKSVRTSRDRYCPTQAGSCSRLGTNVTEPGLAGGAQRSTAPTTVLGPLRGSATYIAPARC